MLAFENTILGKIVAQKHIELRTFKAQYSQSDMDAFAKAAPPVRPFLQAIQQKHQQGLSAVIAEIKKASPSKGVIRAQFQPDVIAAQYEASQAACLSVLTDEQFFQGHIDYFKAARAACALPALRKDFMVEPYHITQSRAIGADCVLLIAACLSDAQMEEMYSHTVELGMDALIEVHDAEEMERALRLPAPLIGVNNRNLKTFDVSLQTTLDLKTFVDASRTLVTESGITSTNDVALMRAQGIHTFLVGESFMRADNPGHALQQLFFAS